MPKLSRSAGGYWRYACASPVHEQPHATEVTGPSLRVHISGVMLGFGSDIAGVEDMHRGLEAAVAEVRHSSWAGESDVDTEGSGGGCHCSM